MTMPPVDSGEHPVANFTACSGDSFPIVLSGGPSARGSGKIARLWFRGKGASPDCSGSSPSSTALCA